MNFFKHQDQARQKTGLLIILFVLGVLTIIGLTVAVITFFFWSFGHSGSYLAGVQQSPLSMAVVIKTAIGIIFVIGSVILFKHLQLSQGGHQIARMLGARPIEQGSQNYNEQQLLNVVEEMAIAAGLPVPPVYVLEQTTINAFAAGFSADNAIIGVTRGTLERLTRDQIQGVIGHEFSHILHGDMRLNLHLITVLSGIIFISQAGRLALHSSTRSRSNQRGGLPVMGIGLSLLIIGSVGVFFASMIKAAVSRQREFLADASAVQYTRNPEGIADALKVIGSGAGSHMGIPHAIECSHLFFGDAVFSRLMNIFSTHPPIEDRILRIQPHWDGSFLTGRPLKERQRTTVADAAKKIDRLIDSVDKTGYLDPVMIAIASALMQSLPKSIYDATHSPGSAYALMLALRLDKDANIRQQQLALLDPTPSLKSNVTRYAKYSQSLVEKDILPIIEMSIPALKRLSSTQYSELKTQLTQFIHADKISNLQEWLHFRLLSHYLDGHFNRNIKPNLTRTYHTLTQIKQSIVVIISLLANQAHQQQTIKDAAFLSAIQHLKFKGMKRIPSQSLQFIEVNKSLYEIDHLLPLLKEQFLQACSRCIQQDDHINANEWGLLRVIAACIGCPMPIVGRPD